MVSSFNDVIRLLNEYAGQAESDLSTLTTEVAEAKVFLSEMAAKEDAQAEEIKQLKGSLQYRETRSQLLSANNGKLKDIIDQMLKILIDDL